MANSILTPTAVTREALRILHQKLNFVGTINNTYDDSYAQSGAKIGDSLKIRLPNEYTVRTGATLSAEDTSETSTTLQVNTQKGVDVNFSSVELTMDLDDFSDRVLQPAMSVLAANIEADALTMYKDVYQQVGTAGSTLTFKAALQARQKLVEALAPMDNSCCVNLSPASNVDMVDVLKGLFQDSSEISKQYKEGYLGRTAGFKWMENTLLGNHTVGTHSTGSTPLTNGADQTGTSIITDGWAITTAVLKKGDTFTIGGVNRVHPETKADTGVLQEFVATADGTSDGSGNLTISCSPAVDDGTVTTAGRQNVSAKVADGAAITVTGTEDLSYDMNLAYQKDAFAFATADLVMPTGVDFAARQVMDGISMRIVRDYDINNDKFPCRIDVLYGYKAIRPQLATRIIGA